MDRAQYDGVINMLGIPAEFHQAKVPATALKMSVGISTMKKDDPLINSYGVGTKIITLKESALGAIVPEKFDFVLINNGAEKVVFEIALPVHEPKTGAVIGYRCVSKGK